MPVSWNIFDEASRQIINAVKPSTLLDVGAGAGKYGVMVKELAPRCRRVAYEREESYVGRFKLTTIYDEVRLYDIYDNMGTEAGVAERWSLVVFGDVLEHMPKSEGTDLIHFFLYRSEIILITVPYQYIQNAVGGVLSEAHVSCWHPHEFIPYTDVATVDAGVGALIMLRGFLCHRADFNKIIDEVPSFGAGNDVENKTEDHS